MLLFVDIATLCRPARPARVELHTGAAALCEVLGPYLGLVQLVLMGGRDEGRGAAQVLRTLPQLSDRVLGSLGDAPPPRALSRYDRIRYWAHVRGSARPPTWLAIRMQAQAWPAEHGTRLIACPVRMPADAARLAVRARLANYYWAELWWGRGPPPDATRRWQAHGLMVAWSVARRRWPRLLGETRAEFERRLDLLLAIHAGARILGEPRRAEHWIHLPTAALGMRRPIEVIEAEGLDGIRRVHQTIWEAPQNP